MKNIKKNRKTYRICLLTIGAAVCFAFILFYTGFPAFQEVTENEEIVQDTTEKTDEAKQQTELKTQNKTDDPSGIENTKEIPADVDQKEHREEKNSEEKSAAGQENSVTAAAVTDQQYRNILQLSAGELAAEGMLTESLADRLFFSMEIDEELLARINGISYTPNENIQPAELSYLRMLCCGMDGNTYVGEMIVNRQIEEEILAIFRELYHNQYPIERMILVDHYDADDEASMQDNNTSAFNYRMISGSNKLSNHSYGMAVDLNPKYNPYVKTASDGRIFCQPADALEYADRSREFAYKIDETDLAYQLFTKAGFTWGGSWNSVKDYQHFEKEN